MKNIKIVQTVLKKYMQVPMDERTQSVFHVPSALNHSAGGGFVIGAPCSISRVPWLYRKVYVMRVKAAAAPIILWYVACLAALYSAQEPAGTGMKSKWFLCSIITCLMGFQWAGTPWPPIWRTCWIFGESLRTVESLVNILIGRLFSVRACPPAVALTV